ncbi:MAG: PilZ domain-containing protein [Desulfomonile tiedjei]|nr:PilZ domain-containing protein [Desulfomonile tiedjei]
MSPKRKIKASEIVPDIRKGMGNSELMEKYNLSIDGLHGVFTKLVHAKVLAMDQLEDRISLPDDPTVIEQIRKTPRAYPLVPFPIYDMDNMEEVYFVRDVSEQGIQVTGINAEVGQKVTFLIQALAFDEVDPFTFEAECRWTTAPPESVDPEPVAGFEITQISDDDSAELMKLVRAIKEESPQPSELV